MAIPTIGNIKRSAKKAWNKLGATGPEPEELTKDLLEQMEKESAAAVEKQKGIKSGVGHLRDEHYNKAGEKDWETVQKHIEELLRGGTEAYYEWQTGMNKILSSLKAFCSAMQTFWPWCTAQTPNPSWDKAHTDNLKITPELNYFVGIDADGFLKTELNVKKKCANGTEETIAASFNQQRLFDGALAGWALENGHTIEKDPKDPQGRLVIKNNTTGAKLDTAALTALKTNPSNGFDSWLANKFALGVEETSTLRTSP